MADNRPKISFTFPYRWLNDPEDRKYLAQNLVKQANAGRSVIPMHPRLQTGFINSYAIMLRYHAYEPPIIDLTKAQLEKIFKEVFPGAKCIAFEKRFVQTESQTSLPVMELEIYY